MRMANVTTMTITTARNRNCPGIRCAVSQFGLVPGTAFCRAGQKTWWTRPGLWQNSRGFLLSTTILPHMAHVTKLRHPELEARLLRLLDFPMFSRS